ncbi:unnamed protein product [Closterium sp. NIES-54]
MGRTALGKHLGPHLKGFKDRQRTRGSRVRRRCGKQLARTVMRRKTPPSARMILALMGGVRWCMGQGAREGGEETGVRGRGQRGGGTVEVAGGRREEAGGAGNRGQGGGLYG